jgi:hypothetical protein
MKFSKSQMAARITAAVLVLLALGAVSNSADAQNRRQNDSRRILEWQGQVDREIRIEIDGGRASVIEVGSNERARRRVNMRGSIPNRRGTLYVEVLQGRGRVEVIQQPNQRNGYRAVIRLRDPDGGAARYRIVAYWDSDRWNDGRRR